MTGLPSDAWLKEAQKGIADHTVTDEILMHLVDGENVRDEGDGVFKITGIEIRQTKDTGAVARGLFFVFATFALDFLLVHIILY